MKIICTSIEQTLSKRNIKTTGCTPLCEYKPYCKKPKDMTCGEYIMSMIKLEVRDE